MKKKIVTLSLAAALAVTAISGTFAYFTDTDKADNTFTIGNVQIAIEETFDKENANLIPGKDINKDVYVKNTGANDAYVRVHIAIPSDLDDGDPNFAALNNFLHFNFTEGSVADGQWSWLPEYSTGKGYKGNGAGNWNFYTAEIDDENYNVYVVTYRSKLAPNATTTTQALDKVYLDKTVDAVVNGNNVTYKDNKGHEVTMAKNATLDIKVYAEGVQAEGFANAYEALNTALGDPTATDYVAPWNK